MLRCSKLLRLIDQIAEAHFSQFQVFFLRWNDFLQSVEFFENEVLMTLRCISCRKLRKHGFFIFFQIFLGFNSQLCNRASFISLYLPRSTFLTKEKNTCKKLITRIPSFMLRMQFWNAEVVRCSFWSLQERSCFHFPTLWNLLHRSKWRSAFRDLNSCLSWTIVKGSLFQFNF